MTCVDDRVRQANDLGREQAAFWEARSAAFQNAEERWEATLEKRLADQVDRTREQLANMEARGLERVREAAFLGEEPPAQAIATGRSKTRQYQAIAEAAAL